VPAELCRAPASLTGASRRGRAQVVLGTESGMITAIVRKVQAMLRESGRADVDVEVVFPVASEAVTAGGGGGSGADAPRLPGGLALVPGPAGGEGCSAEGGCASCPFMKVGGPGPGAVPRR
jgi:quinolinate synthase